MKNGKNVFLKSAFALLCLLAAFPGICFGLPADNPGTWNVSVVKLGEWVKAPELSAQTEVTCHLYGEGKFRVQFRRGEKVIHRVIEAPVEDWVSFTRLLEPGPVDVMIEEVTDSKYPKPSFEALVAVSNPQFVPDLADFKHPLYLQVRNLSDSDICILVDGLRADYSNPHIDLGYISQKMGYVTVDGFAGSGTLKAKESTQWINLSREMGFRSTLRFQPQKAENGIDVELVFSQDSAGRNPIRTFPVKGNPAINETVIIYPNKKDGTFRIINTGELFNMNLKALTDVDLQRPVPRKIMILATYIMDNGESLDTFKAEMELARKIGINGDYYNLGRLESEREKLGTTYRYEHVWIPKGPTGRDRRFSQEWADKNVPSQHTRKGTRNLLELADEPRFCELPKGTNLNADFVAWMKEKGFTPKDAGVTDWNEVQVIEPLPSRKRLSTLSRQFQMEEEIRYWNGYGSAFKKVNSYAEPFVNWQCNEYYEGSTIDLWELYKQPGLDVVWAEDWFEYMPPSSGVTAWYADLMRSQAKYRNLPTGTYPIIGHGGGTNPAVVLLKYYERLMRGCTIFNLYPYSPRGNEASWLDNTKNAVSLAELHRDVAEVEDIIVGGKVLPAKTALVYPMSCMLWDRNAFQKAVALYLAHLHAGIPMDIITEQDVVDGYGKDYRLLYLVGRNIRRDILPIIDTYVKNGGTVVCSSPEIRDPYDEKIENSSKLFGASSMEIVQDEDIGRFAYEFKSKQPVDTVLWGNKEIKIYGQKSKIIPFSGAEVLANFSDGSPAIIRTKKGKGTVYLFGFAPGLSYMHGDYGKNDVFPTMLYQNKDERVLCTFIAAGLENTVKISDAMVGGRIIVNTEASLVGLVDYGIGKSGREKPNPKLSEIDFETMEPYPVTVEITCGKKPDEVYGVRCKQVKWSYSDGKITVVVPLRGAEMLILKGKGLFPEGGTQ